jgi:hypothetical protein
LREDCKKPNKSSKSVSEVQEEANKSWAIFASAFKEDQDASHELVLDVYVLQAANEIFCFLLAIHSLEAQKSKKKKNNHTHTT